MQNWYNKLPEFTKGVLDTVPTFYVVVYVAFFLNLSAGQIMALLVPFLILSFFIERLKAKYIHDRILDAYDDGYEDGIKGEKINE